MCWAAAPSAGNAPATNVHDPVHLVHSRIQLAIHDEANEQQLQVAGVHLHLL